MKINDPLANLLGQHCVNFGGGGAPPAPKMPKQPPFQMPPMPPMNFPPLPPIPPPPPPPPPTPPPPTTSSLETLEAARQAQTNIKKRTGIARSLLAGETGGYSNPVTGGKKSGSLLG